MSDDIEIGIGYDTKPALSSLDNLEKETKKSVSSIEKEFLSLKDAATAAIAIFASKKIIDFFATAIEEAAAADEAVQNLNYALAATGSYSAQASKGVQEFAAQIQETTTFTDDAAIAAFTLAKNFGLSNDAAKNLVTQAANLAAVQKTDLGSATDKLLASLNGQGRALKELGPGFAGLTEEQLKNGDAVRLIASRYSTASSELTKTFNGALAQTKNQLGEVYEAFGRSITQNKDAVIAIKAVGEAFKIMAETLTKNQKGISSGFSLVLGSAAELADIAVNGFAIIATGWLELGKAVGRGAGIIESAFLALTGDFKGAKFAFQDAIVGGNQFVRTLDGFEQGLDKAAALTRRTADAIEGMKNEADGADDQFNKLSKSSQAAAQATGKQIEEARKYVKELTDSTLEGIEKASRAREDEITKIAQFEAQGALDSEEAEAAIFAVKKKYSKASNELKEKELTEGLANLKKFEDERKKAVEQAAADPFTFTISAIKLDSGALADLNNQIALGVGAIKSVLGGKEGAKELVATAAGAIGDAVIPGIGPMVKEITKVLALGPDAVKELVRDFVNELPQIITAIADSAPIFVEAFVDAMVNKGGAVKIAIALARAMSGEASIRELGKQIGTDASRLMIEGAKQWASQAALTISNGIKSSLGNLGNEIANAIKNGLASSGTALANSVAQGITEGANYFGIVAVNSMIKGAQQFYDYATTAIYNATVGMFQAFTGAADHAREQISKPFNELIDFLKKFTWPDIPGVGGSTGNGTIHIAGVDTGVSAKSAGLPHASGNFVVPKGFPNDSYNARLQTDERVVSAKGNDNLEKVINDLASGRQQTNQGPMTVILQIGEQQLAKVMLNLNRQGFRTA